MRSILGLCSVLVLASCAHASSTEQETSGGKSALAPFLRHGAEVAALIEHARVAPSTNGTNGAIVARGIGVAVQADGGFALMGDNALRFRVEGLRGAPRVDRKWVAVGDDRSSALVFDHGAGVEILHRLKQRTPLAYALDLPAGHSLARRADTIEVLDAGGVPRVRLTAEAAWDRDGKKLPVRLSIADRSTIAIDVPADATYPVVIDPTWTTTFAPTRLRRGHAATLLTSGDVLLTGGGSTTAEVFDYVTGRFRAVGSMARSRTGHAAVALENGKVLVVGGSEGTTSLSSTELYDPATGTFTAGPTSFASGTTSALRLVNGKVLAVVDGVATAGLYDASTNTWSTMTRPTAAGAKLVPLANGDVLLFGTGAELYHPSTNTFEALAAPTVDVPVFGGASPLADGRALFYGYHGVSATPGSVSYDRSTAIFNPTTKTFTSGPLVAAPNGSPVGTTLPSGKVMWIGASVQFFDPSTNSWSAPATPLADHSGATATVLPTGDVLVVGGEEGVGALYVATDPSGPGTYKTYNQGVGRVSPRATRLLTGDVLVSGGEAPVGTTASSATTAEVFNATARTWGSAVTLKASRTGHAQVLLPSGKVLIAGGDGTSSAELFDPTTSTTTLTTGSLSAVRAGASATLLPSGKVLLAGGSGLSTAELFDPATGTFAAIASTMSAPHSGHGAALLPNGRVVLVDGDRSEWFDPVSATFTAGPPLSVARDGRSTTLLANGDVLVLGGNRVPQERFENASGTFGLTGALSSNIRGFSAAMLPFGRVVVAGGLMNGNRDSSSGAWIYDPRGAVGFGVFEQIANLPGPRRETTVTALPGGGALVAGGDACANGCVGFPSRESFVFEPWGLSLSTRPTIATVPTTVTPGAPFSITGTNFVGVRELSAQSSARVPVVTFVPTSGQGGVRVAVDSFTNTTATLRVPATVFRGSGFLHVAVAGVTGPGKLVSVDAASNGTACSNTSDCGSGFCVDGVCCDTACDGVCEACTAARKGSGADGACGAIPPAKDSKDACALFQGAACTSDAECASGICADGVCCDARCTGQCESCAVPGSIGTCTPAIGAPLAGKAACDAGTDTCSARLCDGVERASCAGYAPTTTSCRAAGCADGVETLPASCDGKGACPATVSKSCEPFACGDGACLTRCTADSECKDGYRCAAGKCVTGAYCGNDRTLKNPGAADVDCSPYLCEGSGCKTTCVSSLECAGGFVCDGGKCVVPATAGAEEGSGCALGAPGSTSSMAALVLVGLGLLRRRRTTASRRAG